MKGRQTTIIEGAVSEDKIGYWLTPPKLMAELQSEFGFTFDACPYPRPTGFNGLKEDWGDRTYANPPFRGGLMPWARKAITEAAKGKLVVLICPFRMIQWITDPLLDAGAEARLLRRVDWVTPEGKTRKGAPAVLFILRGAPE